MITLNDYLIVAAFLFCTGIFAIISRRNVIVVLMGIELIFNASNLNLIAFSRYDPDLLQGQVFALFVMVIAAAEATVGLAIIVKVYQYFNTIHLDEINEMKG